MYIVVESAEKCIILGLPNVTAFVRKALSSKSRLAVLHLYTFVLIFKSNTTIYQLTTVKKRA